MYDPHCSGSPSRRGFHSIAVWAGWNPDAERISYPA